MIFLDKICIPFKYENEFNGVNKIVKEFDINFIQVTDGINSKTSNITALLDFVRKNKDKNINISFPHEISISALELVNEIHKNIYVRLSVEQIGSVAELKKNNIKFFFDSAISAYNYSMLESLLSLGISQLYISDDLCYNMDEVIKTVREKNVKLRCILNRIPSTALDKGINEKSMIYRPEDLPLLDKYFSCFEFDCGEPYDLAKFDVLFRTFFRKGKWNGNLQELNPDVAFRFDDRFIIPEYTVNKLNCERRCCSHYNNGCKKCKQFLDLQTMLIQKKIRLTGGDSH